MDGNVYVQNSRFVIFLIDLWKIGYGQILSFSDHGPYQPRSFSEAGR